MKKKVLLFGIPVLIIVGVLLFILIFNKEKYVIKISMVDDRSPDRILTIYNSRNEKIEVKQIKYMDGTILCEGYNTAVHFGDIENETELKIILKDKTEVVAKIVKEEVK